MEDSDKATAFAVQDAAETARWERRRRRYLTLASSRLPAWAPGPIVRDVALNLEYMASDRQRQRWIDHYGEEAAGLPESLRLFSRLGGDDEGPSLDLAMLCRLCNYNPDMRKAWETIAGTPIINERFAHMTKHSDGGAVELILALLDDSLKRFRSYPKRTPAARRDSLNLVAMKIRKALQAINADTEALRICRPALRNHIAAEHLKMRIENGEIPHWSEAHVPALIAATVEGIEAFDEDPVPPWSNWTAADRYRWLCREINESSLLAVLAECADLLAETAKEPPTVLQPGRADSGLLPFLSRRLNEIMEMIYGKPLDDTVALLLSAVLATPEPLTREGVRPYITSRKRGTGKISGKKQPKSSRGKIPGRVA